MYSALKRFGRKTSNRIVRRLVSFVNARALWSELSRTYDYPEFSKAYSGFDFRRGYRRKEITGLSKESGSIRGVIVQNVLNTRANCKRVLLPGEYNRDKSFYAELFQLPESALVTAGVDEDMDYLWDYDVGDPPFPSGESFDYIISQAMLEHLVNPYKHVEDLVGLLAPGGHLILHTHPPGFPYHRHPIDCMRFFPDWFEEIAVRLGLTVLDRHVVKLRICYTYVKGSDPGSVVQQLS